MPSACHTFPATGAEYLEREFRSAVRHEYVDGRIHVVAPTDERHAGICENARLLFAEALQGNSACAFTETVLVRIIDETGDFYYYPDVMVAAGIAEEKPRVIGEPKLIVEVVSSSSYRIDQGEKLANYKRLASVEEIVYIEQDWPEIYLVRRSDRWKKHIYTQLDSVIHLESIDLKVPVSAFYRSAPFPADVKRPWYLINREDG